MRPGSSALMADDCRYRKRYGSRLKGFFLSLLVFAGLHIAPVESPAATPTNPQEDASSALSSSFRCPEELTSNDAKQTALREFVKAYSGRFPNKSIRDMMLFRYRLLVAHSCVQTLKSMLMHVSPDSEMLRVGDGDFGPRTEEFDQETKVWTVWFRKDGKPPGLSNEDLIFNFYGWKPPTSAEAIANAFIRPRENLRILGKFGTPDDVTKAPAYFIVSETLYPGERYGYVNISKISSVGTGAYAVTFAKKMTGTSITDIEEKSRAWYISQEGTAISRAVGQVGVDPAWERFLGHEGK